MIDFSETICAIATGPGKGAISIIRISGTKAKSIVSDIFTPASKSSVWMNQANTLHYGTITKQNDIIDDVLVSVFTAPKSYTGEDTIEINCHASLYIQNEILKMLIAAGARLANPGEFTMRAYFNGKLDLSQAEAVADILASSTEASHKLAISQMKGGYAAELQELRKALLHFLAMLELELDFSEEEVEFADRNELQTLVVEIMQRVSKLLQSFELGNAIKHGIPVCIVGEPNVGKSTLLNVILNEEKAIVSEIPGTTRDIIEDSLVINGVTFRFIDTAGIRETSDTIERMGIDRTFQKIEQASFVLLLVDATAPLQSIKNHIKEIKTRISATQKIIVVINKIDVATDLQLEQHCNDMLSEHLSEQDSIVCISAKKKQNIQHLIDILVGDVQYDTISQHDAIVTNIRHFEALQHAHTALEHVLHGLETKLSNDLVSLELRQVLHHIGSITGNISNDEMLGHIFENFCIGK